MQTVKNGFRIMDNLVPRLLSLYSKHCFEAFFKFVFMKAYKKHIWLFCLLAFPRFPCGCCLAVARCRPGDATLSVHISGSLITSVLSLSLSHWSSLCHGLTCHYYHVSPCVEARGLSPLSSPLLSLLCLSHCVTASLTSLPSLVSGLADYQLMVQNSADRV